MKYPSVCFLLAAIAAGAVPHRAAAQNEKSIALISVGSAPMDTARKHVTAFTGDLGFVSASGNTNITTLSIGDKIVRTDGRWMFTQSGAYVNGETNNKQTANQLLLNGRVDYDFQPRLGVFAGVMYERNTFAGFNSRMDEIAGLAWLALVAPFDTMRVDAGGVYTQENDVDNVTQNYPSARTAIHYKHQFTKRAYFSEFAEYLPNLQTSGSYRFNTESALVAPLSSHVGIKVAYAIRYDSRPQPTFGTTDRLLTTGVQISY